jgi:uncharacterized protein with gpF-like domain
MAAIDKIWRATVPEIIPQPLPFDEAIAYWQGKVPLAPEEFYALAAEARAKAFTVSGVTRMDMIEEVKAAVESALKNGTTLADFKKSIKDVIEAAGWPGSRVDTIFTSNVQGSYNNGRYAQQTDPDVVARRPYWQYLHSPGVANPRPDHLAMDGKVFAADDPIWDEWYPYRGSRGDWYNCHCSVRTLSDDELAEFGLAPEERTGAPRSPQGMGTPWQPDLSKYSDDLRARFEAEQASRSAG